MTTSIWDTVPHPKFPPVSHDHTCQTCIVGSGIAGLTTAYILTQHGHPVTIVTAGEHSAGESARTSAQINWIHDDGWAQMLRLHGEEKMQLCLHSYRSAVHFI